MVTHNVRLGTTVVLGANEESSGMEEETFHAIYAATAKPLWAYIARVSGRPDVANDLLQETYCRFLTSRLSNRELAETKPYLFCIATNLINDRWRNGEDTTSSEPPEIGFERDLDTEIELSPPAENNTRAPARVARNPPYPWTSASMP